MSKMLAEVPATSYAEALEIDEDNVPKLKIPFRKLEICNIEAVNGESYEQKMCRVSFSMKYDGENIIIDGSVFGSKCSPSVKKPAKDFLETMLRELQEHKALANVPCIQEQQDAILQQLGAEMSYELSSQIALDTAINGTGIMYADGNPIAGFSQIKICKFNDGLALHILGCTKSYNLIKTIEPMFRFWYKGNQLDIRLKGVIDAGMDDIGLSRYEIEPRLKYSQVKEAPDFPVFDGDVENYLVAVSKATATEEKERDNVFDGTFSLF